jgi:RNA polymerase sigma-70 factor (ECF subfamily)
MVGPDRSRYCMPDETRSLRLPDVLLTDGDARGDSRSEDSRWSALAAAMVRAVRRQCPAWLSDCAQDIAQAALTKVMAAERRSEGERSLSTFYLQRVAHSALVDEIRHRKRRPEVPLERDREEDDGPPALEPAGRGDPESTASFRELGSAVRDCLMCAKRERRLAVTLYLLGHSVPEAARILGWDAKRTENLVYRGLADLRQCLAGKGHKP